MSKNIIVNIPISLKGGNKENKTPCLSLMTHVPLLDLKLQYKSIQEEIENAVLTVLRKQACILGETVKSFEKACAEYCGTQYAVGVSSGTDALLVALMALGIKSGDEVITTSYSFFATAGSIYRVGAKAVFVDIDRDSFNINPALIEAAITPRTKAIIPVHLYGQCADMDAIREIAKKHNLFIIEDAAQAIGAEYKGIRAGNLGNIGCFSFYPSKNLGGIGDGGLVTTNDPELYNTIVKLRNHGCATTYYHEIVGGNFRLDAVQAAALQVKLQHLEKWHEARAKNAEDYRNLFTKAGLDDIVICPKLTIEGRHVYNQFVIRVPKRDELREYLSQQDIATAIYYPLPLHLQPCFSCLEKVHLPESEEVSKTALALPIYPELTMEQKEAVVEGIRKFYK
jgi:dTDP-4-amino-4,6-dideoxygalactose transaminase